MKVFLKLVITVAFFMMPFTDLRLVGAVTCPAEDTQYAGGYGYGRARVCFPSPRYYGDGLTQAYGGYGVTVAITTFDTIPGQGACNVRSASNSGYGSTSISTISLESTCSGNPHQYWTNGDHWISVAGSFSTSAHT